MVWVNRVDVRLVFGGVAGCLMCVSGSRPQDLVLALYVSRDVPGDFCGSGGGPGCFSGGGLDGRR